MTNKGPIPADCPECNGHIVDWQWDEKEFTDFGLKQKATCPECGTSFMEYSEPVDYERIDNI